MREHLVGSAMKYYRWFDTSDNYAVYFASQSWESLATNGVWEQTTLSPFGYSDISHERTRYKVDCSITVPYGEDGRTHLEADWWRTANPTWAMPVVYGALVDPPQLARQYVNPSPYIASEGLHLVGIGDVPAGNDGDPCFAAWWTTSGDSQSYKGPQGDLPPVPLLWLALNPLSNVSGYTTAQPGGSIAWNFSIRSLFSRPQPWDGDS